MTSSLTSSVPRQIGHEGGWTARRNRRDAAVWATPLGAVARSRARRSSIAGTLASIRSTRSRSATFRSRTLCRSRALARPRPAALPPRARTRADSRPRSADRDWRVLSNRLISSPSPGGRVRPMPHRVRARSDKNGHGSRRKSEKRSGAFPSLGDRASSGLDAEGIGCADDRRAGPQSPRSARFRILPVGPFGSSPTISTMRGYL